MKRGVFVSRNVNLRRQVVASRSPHPRFYAGIVHNSCGPHAHDPQFSTAKGWNNELALADDHSTTRPKCAYPSSYFMNHMRCMFCQIQLNLELRHIDISVHLYMFSTTFNNTSTVNVKLINIDLKSIYHEMILYRLQTM